jgi:hypothetical protein
MVTKITWNFTKKLFFSISYSCRVLSTICPLSRKNRFFFYFFTSFVLLLIFDEMLSIYYSVLNKNFNKSTFSEILFSQKTSVTYLKCKNKKNNENLFHWVIKKLLIQILFQICYHSKFINSSSYECWLHFMEERHRYLQSLTFKKETFSRCEHPVKSR